MNDNILPLLIVATSAFIVWLIVMPIILLRGRTEKTKKKKRVSFKQRTSNSIDSIQADLKDIREDVQILRDQHPKTFKKKKKKSLGKVRLY